MDKKIVAIAKRYAEKAKQIVPASMVILYGSYAKGTAISQSDIDIAVVLDKAPVDYLRTSANLFGLIVGLDERIEPVLLIKGHDKSGFLESILKHGRIIYKAKH
jgi:predicted nucleotidyltransferase